MPGRLPRTRLSRWRIINEGAVSCCALVMSVESRAMSSDGWGLSQKISVPVNLVLIIEDDPSSAERMRSALERHHVTVRVAKDGGQAQATFSMHKPDFVILDLILPGESGFEICERFKSSDASVPVLVITEMDRVDSRELAKRVGADGYLTKPIDADQLIETVREIAERVWKQTHSDQESDETRIRFTCTCGKKFKVSSTRRGKRLTCPQCGEPVTIPQH